MGELGLESRTDPTPAAPLVQIGTPLKKKADRQRAIEEERKFTPLIYWYLSFRCNLACAHCSVKSSPWVDTSEDLTTEECMQVVDQMADLGVKGAILTGGEFLIRPDALQIVRALSDRGIHASIESNGLRFDKAFAELARELQPKGLISLAISLDGGTRDTHERLRGPRSFDRTVRGLRFLKENGIRFQVQCVLNGANFHTIPEFYRLAEELYPECWQVEFAVLNPIGRGVGLVEELGLSAEHIDRIFPLIRSSKTDYPGHTLIKVPPAMVPPRHLSLVMNKKERTNNTMTCQFPLLGVLPNGNVSICALSRDQEDLLFGNIREGARLKDIWQRTRMDMLRSKYVAADDLEGICSDCVWKYSCKGACRAWAYEEGQSFNAPFPICKALDDAGTFPKTYRLSHLNAEAAQAYQQMQGAGCGCPA